MVVIRVRLKLGVRVKKAEFSELGFGYSWDYGWVRVR